MELCETVRHLRLFHVVLLSETQCARPAQPGYMGRVPGHPGSPPSACGRAPACCRAAPAGSRAPRARRAALRSSLSLRCGARLSSSRMGALLAPASVVGAAAICGGRAHRPAAAAAERAGACADGRAEERPVGRGRACRSQPQHGHPVHKRGSVADVNNYRPIAVGTALLRLYAVLLKRRLFEYTRRRRSARPRRRASGRSI
jgi:hypothetical protein